jgi:translation elongation factor EF-Tu-like GTPase
MCCGVEAAGNTRRLDVTGLDVTARVEVTGLDVTARVEVTGLDVTARVGVTGLDVTARAVAFAALAVSPARYGVSGDAPVWSPR